MGEGFEIRDVGAAVVAVRADRHGLNTKGMGASQVIGVIIHHQAFEGLFIDGGQRFMERLDLWFAVGVKGVDINDMVKMTLDG